MPTPCRRTENVMCGVCLCGAFCPGAEIGLVIGDGLAAIVLYFLYRMTTWWVHACDRLGGGGGGGAPASR